MPPDFPQDMRTAVTFKVEEEDSCKLCQGLKARETIKKRIDFSYLLADFIEAKEANLQNLRTSCAFR
jgi:hypothetical protein